MANSVPGLASRVVLLSSCPRLARRLLLLHCSLSTAHSRIALALSHMIYISLSSHKQTETTAYTYIHNIYKYIYIYFCETRQIIYVLAREMFLCLLVSHFLFIRYLVIAVLCVVLRIAQLLLLLWPQFSTVFVFVFRANLSHLSISNWTYRLLNVAPQNIYAKAAKLECFRLSKRA